MVKKLVCVRGDEGSIPFYDIINLVLNDYNMSTHCVLNEYIFLFYVYIHMNITHSCFGHDMTPCHVELFKQAIWHDSNDHTHSIQYNYKSNCKQSFFSKILQVIVVQYVCTRVCIHVQCVHTSTMTTNKSSNLHYFWFTNCNLKKDYVKSLKQVPSLSDG
jgi:hypothetical protein